MSIKGMKIIEKLESRFEAQTNGYKVSLVIDKVELGEARPECWFVVEVQAITLRGYLAAKIGEARSFDGLDIDERLALYRSVLDEGVAWAAAAIPGNETAQILDARYVAERAERESSERERSAKHRAAREAHIEEVFGARLNHIQATRLYRRVVRGTDPLRGSPFELLRSLGGKRRREAREMCASGLASLS